MSRTKTPRRGKATYQIRNGVNHAFQIAITGRDRWALECLMAAGAKGCTPIDTPGPRWAGYVHTLRQMGVAIETITEPHGGPFKGTHARYVLRSEVVCASESEVAQ